MYARAIETDFGICVEMKNCALVENLLENDIYYPEDEAPLTLSWLSSRWQESTSVMNRNVQSTPSFRLNNSRFVYQTMINYRRSLKLREGMHDSSISEEMFNREGECVETMSRHTEDRQARTSPEGTCKRTTPNDSASVKAGPKKMWIRHYYTSNGKDRLVLSYTFRGPWRGCGNRITCD